MAKGSRLPD